MILDTNAISALAMKNIALLSRLDDAKRLAVTLISLAEYAFGIRRSSVRHELELWLREQLLIRAEILGREP